MLNYHFNDKKNEFLDFLKQLTNVREGYNSLDFKQYIVGEEPLFEWFVSFEKSSFEIVFTSDSFNFNYYTFLDNKTKRAEVLPIENLEFYTSDGVTNIMAAFLTNDIFYMVEVDNENSEINKGFFRIDLSSELEKFIEEIPISEQEAFEAYADQREQD